MNPAPDNRPDLRRIGESAFAEVLDTLFSWPVTTRNASHPELLSAAPAQVTSTVLLSGPRLCGSVHFRLPSAFVAQAFHRLTGLDAAAGDSQGALDDAAGELANMVAGRVGVRLAAEGYPCSLGTPSVDRSAEWADETPSGAGREWAELVCEGHRLLLGIQFRYTGP